ncbi:TonB-dependent receptor plug domain-containing protein [Massilia aurea]|uniref:TonB-dependent receptor plug domain-containing protein n=1 Tax=Massilia aurea TaxID=373040 RepID=UPI002162E01C|nr:TonB-dependent receptor [Massilia aurea]MCS0709583.1 TonB-dependent receptor [Massilia aurea]
MPPFSLYVCAIAALLSTAYSLDASAQDGSGPLPWADYSLEQLSDIAVTSVSRQSEPLARAAASVFVISAADIARSGATTLPEVLRLAPNLQVARINTHEYAISARGFLSPQANKLLVMIDGRSVYSPLFSGVVWEMQDVGLEDVARIEVVSGPGGTVWGTNAVNGVINIITRSAAQTHGGVVTAYAGPDEHGAGVRYGGQFENGPHWRVYARQARIEADRTPADAPDNRMAREQAGFRLDWEGSEQDVTLSGDVYQGRLRNTSLLSSGTMSGANLRAEVQRDLADAGQVRMHAWLDQTRRSKPGVGMQQIDTVDVEAQHLVRFGAHGITWGGGYRNSRDQIDGGPVLRFTPARRNLRWSHLFVQDELTLTPTLRAVAGMRVEHNVYTGSELLPNLRLAWDASDQATLWAALSRTVRAPSRIDRDLFLVNPASPRQFLIAGGADTVAETARVAELGYRAQPMPTLSYSATLFYTDFERLRSLEPATPGVRLPYVISSLGKGNLRGIEFWASWQAARGWRLHAGGLLQDVDMGREPASRDTTGLSGLGGNDPNLTWTLRSAHDLSERIWADFSLRYVARLPQLAVPSYHELDARIAWQVRPDLELALAGRNLLHARHAEFVAAGSRQLLERTVFASATLRF